jgi:signal peptidase I
MLPTVLPKGEIYLRIKSWAMRPPEVGHVVVFQDFRGRYACKRTIGVENDDVDVNGEYSSTIYKDRKDLGVPTIPVPNALPVWRNEAQINDGRMKVPAGTLWVEGDNPLDSIDSRHYGPVPLSKFKGRIIYRLWPRRRNEEMNSSCVVSSSRPDPTKINISSKNEQQDS